MTELPRDLTPEEQDILDLVIAANIEYRDELEALLRDTKATPNCNCGCGSITLTTNPSAVERRTWPTPLLGGATANVEGVQFIAMLFADLESAGLEFVTSPLLSRLPQKHELAVRWEEWFPDRTKPGEPRWISARTGKRRPWNDGIKPQG